MRKLSDAGLTVRKDKCKFFTDSFTTFLGYQVDKRGLHVSDKRVEAIANVKILKSIQEVKAFLGLVYYLINWLKNGYKNMTEKKLGIKPRMIDSQEANIRKSNRVIKQPIRLNL